MTSRRLVFALAATALAAVQSLANVRIEVEAGVPGGGPIYARIERGLIHHDGEWAAIAFYRIPECVPGDFNLLDFFDVPRSFDCPFLAEGFEIWQNGPPEDLAPLQSKLTGAGAVPVWFVRWGELSAAVADDVLTMDELHRMASLTQGIATFFQETLHPAQPDRQTMTTVVATGVLDDGRSFRYHATETGGTVRSVEIVFSPSRPSGVGVPRRTGRP
jgi:hypothetical protein